MEKIPACGKKGGCITAGYLKQYNLFYSACSSETVTLVGTVKSEKQ